VIISQAAPGERAVRFISGASGSYCETVAKLVSVTADDSELNIGSTAEDHARSAATAVCQTQEPSRFSISDTSGIQHHVGPDSYHYDRDN
jgi:hypothetical protein